MPARPIPTIATLATAAVLLLGATACGGSDSSAPAAPATTAAASTPAASDPASAPATDDEFVAAANAVCEQEYPAINAFLATLDPNELDVDAVASGFVPLVTTLQDDLAALTAPDDLATAWQQVIDDQQAQLDQVTSDPASLADIGGESGDAINSEFDALGVTSCGSESGSFT